EQAGARLIVTVALAPRNQHLLLERRDAGDMYQDPIHESGRQQARPAPGIEKRVVQRNRDHGISEPAQPFEEIIRMARPSPQADVAHQAAIFRLLPETL